ncbi:hypothetical protein Tco_0120925 [Tanacetum coccineum]
MRTRSQARISVPEPPVRQPSVESSNLAYLLPVLELFLVTLFTKPKEDLKGIIPEVCPILGTESSLNHDCRGDKGHVASAHANNGSTEDGPTSVVHIQVSNPKYLANVASVDDSSSLSINSISIKKK